MKSDQQKIRVAVVEDNASYRRGLQSIFKLTPNITPVLMASNALEALRDIPKLNPDIVLMDLNLPRISGAECILELRRLKFKAPIVVLTQSDSSEQVFPALSAGAVGYLLKESTASEIVESIEMAIAGESPMSPSIGRMVVESFHVDPPADGTEVQLSERESEVIGRIARGKRPKEIAAELGLAVSTIQTFIRRVYEKLEVHSQAEAVARYLRKKRRRDRPDQK